MKRPRTSLHVTYALLRLAEPQVNHLLVSGEEGDEGADAETRGIAPEESAVSEEEEEEKAPRMSECT